MKDTNTMNLSEEQKVLYGILKKYNFNRVEIMNNANTEITKNRLGITKDVYRKRVDRLLEKVEVKVVSNVEENSVVVDTTIEDVLKMKDTEIGLLRQDLNSLKLANKNYSVADYKVKKLVDAISDSIKASKPDSINFKVNVKTKANGTNRLVMPLSDLHFGEVVAPEQINKCNEYNTAIAKRRIEALAAEAIKYAVKHECSILDIPMLGDMFSGNIHEELIETNEMTMPQAVIDLTKFLVGVINGLSEHFTNVNLYCVVGNHSRVSKEWKTKNKVIDNWEYVLYHNIKMMFEAMGNTKVSVEIPDSSVYFAKIGNQYWKLEHGDAYKGGGSFVSPLSTVIRDSFKDYIIFSNRGLKADVGLMGHWHIGGIWYLSSANIPVYFNPSIVGPNSYSLQKLHSDFPPSSYLIVTDGDEITSSMLVKLDNV